MFITNSGGYYFQVNCVVDVSELKECNFHNSLDDMYRFIADTTEQEFEDVEGWEMILDMDNNMFTLKDGRQIISDLHGVTDLEDYITNFSL